MLKNYVAVVTGSTSGIGLAIAEMLAQNGAHVVLNGIVEAREAAKLTERLASQYKVKVLFSGADLSKSAEAKGLISYAEQELGKVDVLVNNAGIQFTALVEDFPDDKWDAVLATNLSASFHTIKASIAGMKKRNFGRIINIASAHGLVASGTKSAYVAAKHGLLGLTKVVALENAEHDITCNAICPGWVLTGLVQKQIEGRAAANHSTIEQETVALVGEKQPNKRFSAPADIANMVLFLANPSFKAATGASFSIDGGWTAW